MLTSVNYHDNYLFGHLHSKKKTTYTVGTQLQHPQNVHSYEHQFHCDCSSEERTLYQYIAHYPGVLGQSLVQMQHRTQQQGLQKTIIYPFNNFPGTVTYVHAYVHILIFGPMHNDLSFTLNTIQIST